jgi:glycosyltransferase involved in cell wall biosynthesis
MPKVLRILNRLIIGGPSKNALFLTKHMHPEFETLLVCGAQEDHEQSEEYLASVHGIQPVYISEMKRKLNFRNDWIAYKKLKKIIREFKPDIVHTHAAKSGALGRLAAKHCGVPVIVHTFHGHVFHSYFNSLKSNLFVKAERWLAGFTDAIVAISVVQKKELSEKYKIAPVEKFDIIPLGLELDNFVSDQESKRSKFRNEFGLDNATIAIGIIGRLVPVKNHSLFLKGLKRVLENSDKKIKAFIIGDGDSRNEIEQTTKSLGIDFTRHTDSNHPHSLVFTSWRTDVDIIYAGLDIVALTSLNEGTPVSLIEAQAAGKPIVSTRVGGIADVVLENKTALLSDINDENGFAENLLKMVTDDTLRNSLKDVGRDHVLTKFGYKRLANDMKALYYDLLKRKSKPKN